MKSLAILFALAAVLGSSAALPKNLETLIKNMCPGVICPSGCCPEPGYVCCKDNVYCADTLGACPEHPKRAQLKSMATKKISQEKCDGPMCGGKCCPMEGWVCCSDNVYCADTLGACPEHPKRAHLKSMATKKIVLEKCDGPMCGGKCCPMEGWVCCSDNVYCADGLDACPEHPRTAQLLKLTKLESKQDDCPGVICPSGCCSKPGWVCCPDDVYCASVLEFCPSSAIKINRLIDLATKKSEVKCDGPMCPGGCCPHSGFVCCPDGQYCAASLDKCPGAKTKLPTIFTLAPKSSQHKCDGPMCPGGCCPHSGFVCCPDGQYCAATLDKCPNKILSLVKLAARRTAQCDGTPCPGGCCPAEGWYCCPDEINCAAAAEFCP